MKRLTIAGLVLAASLHGAPGDEGKFTAIVSPEDFAAAGLTGLTPAQLARLNALVENYKSGALVAARRAAEDALLAKQAAEAQAARSEAKAEVARADAAKAEAARSDAVKAEAARAEATKSASTGSFLAKARGLLKSEPKAEVVAVESSIPGKFRGWAPHQIFTLANGQSWQVANNDNYFTPTIENPKIQIVPATLAGFWLRFPDLDAQVRVNLVGEK